MARRKNSVATGRSGEDLAGILARLSDARCVLECGVRCLEEHPERVASDDAVCLCHALDLVECVYDDLDRVVSHAGLGPLKQAQTHSTVGRGRTYTMIIPPATSTH